MVMLLWFIAIGALGIGGIMRTPAILEAVSPHYALIFLVHAGPGIGFAVLGAAFLAVTGAEAMYADMGHFGRLPVRLGWFTVALPALVLNYFGQGALLLSDPGAIKNPFYWLVPRWAHYIMVAFATIATIIASQAIISGAYSLTRQSIQLGFLPRMPSRPMAMNQSSITGPKMLPTNSVPLRCTKNRPSRIAMLMGTTSGASSGASSLRPSTALSTEIAGVITPSP